MSAIGQRVVAAGVGSGLELSVAELYAKSKAAEFGLAPEQFAAILDEVAAKGYDELRLG